MLTLHHSSLLHRNTFGIDQRCDCLIEFASAQEAQSVAQELTPGQPLLLLGGGSNLLLTQDFHGTVVTPQQRMDVELQPDPTSTEHRLLRCWAGCPFDDVVQWAVDHQLHGLENLSLIPGQCGASAVQNIGAYGVEICDLLHTIHAVEVGTGRCVQLSPSDCQYAYRYSRFKGEWRQRFIITHVVYRLSTRFSPHLDYGNVRSMLAERGLKAEEVTAQQLRDTIIHIRSTKLPDPAIMGNAGSFFMNPIVSSHTLSQLVERFPSLPHYSASLPDGTPGHKIPAGWLIDQCGWKGRALGPAGVHQQQALVLVNLGGAKGADIVRLMEAVQHDVEQRFGLRLHPEVNVL